MTFYVKGFKLDEQKITNLVGARDGCDPLFFACIDAILDRINRAAYLRLEGGYEPGPDGTRRFIAILALEIGHDEDELKKKDLGEIDETIRVALPHVLEGPDVWELW